MLLDVLHTIPRWFKSKIFGKDKPTIGGLRLNIPTVLGDPYAQQLPHEGVWSAWRKMLAKFPTFRYIFTQQSKHNMPCPECNRGSRRTIKVDTGAMYKCSNHDEFLVKG